MHATTDAIQHREPGHLVHAVEDDGLRPSGCTLCGIPCRTSDGELDNRCPACEIAPQVEAEWLKIRKPQVTKVGRNEPCPCGSGHKRCCAE